LRADPEGRRRISLELEGKRSEIRELVGKTKPKLRVKKVVIWTLRRNAGQDPESP